MQDLDERAMAVLTAPGAPFELIDIAPGGVAMRGFRRAEASLTTLFASFEIYADRPFIIEGERRLTYAETAAAAARLTLILRDHGVRPGDRVAIAMNNSAEWMVGFIAALAAGAIPALVNSRGTAGEMAAAVALVDAPLALTDGRRREKLHDRVECLIPMLDTAPGAPPLPRPDASPDDPALILFTSGTTGQAKGATLSHRSALTGLLLAQMAGAMIAMRMYGEAALAAPRPQQAPLLAFPLFHVSGCHATFLSALAAGNRLVLAPRWEPDAIVTMIHREGITNVAGSPAMIWDLVRAKRKAGIELPSLIAVSTGGQAQPVNLLDAVVETFPNAVVGTGFGSTETAGAIAMHTGDDYRAHPRAAGRILSLAEVRIRDQEGRDLPNGRAGEIVVRGPMVMSGYWNDPAATAKVLDPQGWFRTGDVGAVDDAGNLTILDRLTDMVICGGENIYCAEVEAALQQHPHIVEAAAFGLADERLGERLVAVVRVEEGAGLGPADVNAALAGRIADYKIPRTIFTTDSGLPRNALGKVDKRKLRAAYAEEGAHDAAA